MDNTTCHNDGKISLELEHNKIEQTPHPAYSPAISLRDFWLFDFLKEKLKESELSTLDGIIEAITTIWNDVTFEELQSMFSEWIQRVTLVIEHGEEYYNKSLLQFLEGVLIGGKNMAVRTFWTPYMLLCQLKTGPFSIGIKIRAVLVSVSTGQCPCTWPASRDVCKEQVASRLAEKEPRSLSDRANLGCIKHLLRGRNSTTEDKLFDAPSTAGQISQMKSLRVWFLRSRQDT
jgi:hypothetical protein